MQRPSALLFALVAALSFASLRAAVPLNRLAGADTTILLTVDDLGTLQKNWLQSPFGKTWNDPQVVRFLAPLREAMHIDEWDNRCRAETGKSVDQLISGFGSMALLITDLAPAIEDQTRKTPPAVLLAVDLRDNRDAFVKMIEKERKKDRQSEVTEEFQGETLHMETPPNASHGEAPFCWVITGDVLMAGPGKAIVQKALSDYKRGGAESPCVETDGYRREVRRLPHAQIRFYVNMERVMAAVRAAASRAAANQNPNPMGLTPDVIMTALGLDSFRGLSLSCEIGEKSSTMVWSVAYDQPHGIARLFTASTEGRVPDPTFLSGDWATVSSARFRIGVLYDVIEEVVRGMGPAIDGMFEGQVANLNKRAGIDIKRDIFENFGDEMYSAAQIDAPDAGVKPFVPKQKQLLVVSLNDPKAFEAALMSLQNGLLGPAAAQMFPTRDYLGATIHTMMKVAPGAAPGAAPSSTPVFSYAVAQRHFVLGIGGDDLVEMAIQNLNSPQPSYWSRPAVRDALAKLPPGANGYGYADLHKLAPTYFNLFAQIMTMSQMRVKDGHIVTAPHPGPMAGPANGVAPSEPAPVDQGKPVVDMAQKPSAETIAQYWGPMTSANYRDEGEVHTVIRLEYPQ